MEAQSKAATTRSGRREGQAGPGHAQYARVARGRDRPCGGSLPPAAAAAWSRPGGMPAAPAVVPAERPARAGPLHPSSLNWTGLGGAALKIWGCGPAHARFRLSPSHTPPLQVARAGRWISADPRSRRRDRLGGSSAGPGPADAGGPPASAARQIERR